MLVVELWGVGDLVIATPFLRAAVKYFEITLLAKPFALELKSRLFPEVQVVPFTAPWTAFRRKYDFRDPRWREVFDLRRKFRPETFEFGVSARPDPRDHLLLKWIGAEDRVGFPRLGSAIYLTDPLTVPEPTVHRYELWRLAGKAFGIELPTREKMELLPRGGRQLVVVHSGARLPARVWPLEYYKPLVRRLREAGYTVQVVCDPDQQDQWHKFGESAVASPRTLAELFAILDRAAVFIGNCSGPGHLAAIGGTPTFTFFGPSLPEWFAPLHPQAEWIEDKSCPYKPCKDYCHFPTPRCLENIAEETAWPRIEAFVQAHLSGKD